MLAVPGQLERFLPEEDCLRLRSVFAGLYTLDDSEPNSGVMR